MKRGKREKVKSPTLQSYILSMLSLVLCCAMFMSATMAWFTSEVTTTGNQIYVGTLDVDLRDANNKTLHGTTSTLFDQVLLRTLNADNEPITLEVTHWQDNAIALEPLQVVNEGDLAFRYDLYLTLAVDSSDETDLSGLSAVTDQFEVWVLKDDMLPSTEYVDVTAENSGWTQVVVTITDSETNAVTEDTTLTAILENGTALFSGTMIAEEVAGKKQTAHEYTVALRMKDTSATVIEVDEDGNEITVSIMGKTLTLNTKLVASQLIEEQTTEDSTDGNSPTGEQSAPENDDSTTEDLTAEGGEPTT